MIKQIVLQLDSERYKVLITALQDFTHEEDLYNEKERVIAEQLRGLIMTQFTGSRHEN